MKKLNIAELLRGCPTGMELDCTICDNVYFDEVTPNMIKCFIKNDVYNTIYFHHDGTYLTTQNAKCVIFPKGKTTWEGFQRPFKDGDVVTDIEGAIIIYKGITTSGYCGSFVSLDRNNQFIPHYISYLNYIRFATEEEKETLFKAIKDNNYRWNPETKTLEKLVVPKFKVGDRIANRNSISTPWIVSSISSEYYGLKLPNSNEGIGVLPVSKQDEWELIQVVPKFKVGDRITNGKVSITIGHIDDNYYYEIGRDIAHRLFIENQDDWRLEKFDITTLKPFESRVLVRTNNYKKWVAAFYSHYDKDSLLHHCVVGGLWYEQCVPYNGNEHLLDTTNDCDEFYKTWK